MIESNSFEEQSITRTGIDLFDKEFSNDSNDLQHSLEELDELVYNLENEIENFKKNEKVNKQPMEKNFANKWNFLAPLDPILKGNNKS